MTEPNAPPSGGFLQTAQGKAIALAALAAVALLAAALLGGLCAIGIGDCEAPEAQPQPHPQVQPEAIPEPEPEPQAGPKPVCKEPFSVPVAANAVAEGKTYDACFESARKTVSGNLLDNCKLQNLSGMIESPSYREGRMGGQEGVSVRCMITATASCAYSRPIQPKPDGC